MITKILKLIPDFNVKNIKKINSIENNFTNECHKIILNDGSQYFFRKAQNKAETPRDQENYVHNLIKDDNLIWYDLKNGHMLKKWVDGKTDFFWTNGLLKKFIQQIKKIQKINYDPQKILNHNHFIPENILKRNWYQKYQKLILKYQNLLLNFCHNDLNPGNIILKPNNELYIFDWEWSRINTIYWELANFARESLNEKQMLFLIKNFKNLNSKIFQDFLFITSCYAIYWSFLEKQTLKVIKYRQNVYQRWKIISQFNF